MFQRKALEPLIASILLIVVVVILVTFVLSFGSDFTNKSLTKTETVLDSSKEAVSGLFYLNQVNGNYLQLTNLSKEDYNFTGYTILSTDYNSDYFWINSYRPFETNISFLSGSKALFPLLCMPASKFKLELQDISGNRYTTDISPISNSGYISCNQYHVPLWEFETINGSYLISEFQKTKPNNFFIDTGMGISGNVVNIDEKTWSFTSDGSTSTYIYNSSISYTLGRKYKVEMETLSSSGIIGDDQFYFQRFSLGLNYLDDNGVPIKEVGRHTLTIWCNRESSAYFQLQLNSLTNANIVIRIDSITEIDPLPTMTNGTRYLENTVAGISSISSSQAYGTWEFDLYKGLNKNPRIHIISNNTEGYSAFEGYMLFVYPDTQVTHLTLSLGGSGSALMVTNSNFIKDAFWYKVKITRDRENKFTFFIKGPFFTPTLGYGDWTLVPLSGGLNPVVNSNYIESNYFVIDLDPGDRIANIKITPEIDN